MDRISKDEKNKKELDVNYFKTKAFFKSILLYI